MITISTYGHVAVMSPLRFPIKICYILHISTALILSHILYYLVKSIHCEVSYVHMFSPILKYL
jgi:hypothetical protein